MAQAISSPPDAPGLDRLLDRLGIAPHWAGLGVAVGLLAVFAVWEAAYGRQPLLPDPSDPEDGLRDTRLAVVHCLLLGFLFASTVIQIRASRTLLTRSRSLLNGSPAELDAREAAVGHYPGVGPWLMFVAVLLLLVGATYLTTPRVYWPILWSWTDLTPEVRWHRILTPVLALGIARHAIAASVEPGRVASAARTLRPLDLLELDVLAPFTRWALTNVLLTAALGSIVALFLLDGGFLVLVGLAWGVTLGLTAAALWRPLRALNERIREAKLAELAFCRRALREARDALDAGQQTPRSLADLVAWEARIASVREWPFDPASLRRIGLYLLIPLGSWSGGALVERMIDSLLE